MRRRFVEEEERRALQQRGGDRDALALAARERLHVARDEGRELQAIEDALDLVVVAHAVVEQCTDAEVAPTRERRRLAHGRGERVGPELRAPRAPRREERRPPRRERDAVDTDASAGEREDAGERGEQRRLAGAVRTDDDPALAGLDAEVEPLDEGAAARAATGAQRERFGVRAAPLLLPASAIAGGTFVVAVDAAARTVVAPLQLPVGVLAAAIGVPTFIAMLLQRPAAKR